MMEKIKNFFAVKKHLYWTIAITIILIIVMVVLIVLAIILKRYDYATIENMLVTQAKNYLAVHEEDLPKNGLSYILDSQALINNGYLKDFSKLSKDTNCSGSVLITNNEGKYRYTPTFNCDNYATKSLKMKILENEKIVTDKDGLFLESENLYRYKGDFVNNYVSFADKSWRIFKIDDNLIYLILSDVVPGKNSNVVFDDRYNEEAEADKGKSDFDSSRIKDELLSIYNNDLKSHDVYIASHEICKNARGKTDTDKTGSIECFTKSTGKISLLPIYDYMGASRDALCETALGQNCTNYNYITQTSDRWWLLTPNSAVSYKLYYVTKSGDVDIDVANVKKGVRYVITLPSDVNYKKGNGQKDNPYTIYEY